MVEKHLIVFNDGYFDGGSFITK